MKMEELEFVKSMQTLNIQDGDILVIKVDRMIDAVTHANIAEAIKRKLPQKMKDMPVFIADPSWDIGVLRKEGRK